MTIDGMAGPLDGIRVLDLSRVLAGPWATQLLADFGAEVIKVERPGTGDDTRSWGPPWLTAPDSTGHRDSAYFQSTNRNKRSITCDFQHPEGAQLLRALAATCDVFVENFRAGTLDRYGLGATALQTGNPMLVYCSISAYARGSGRANEPGYDAMVQAAGGLMSLTGESAAAGGRPQKVGVAIADIMAGMYAGSAILAALHSRHRDGRGEIIEVPLFDSQVAWLANQAMNYLLGGVIPDRHGTGHPNIVPYQAFATADRDIMLAVGTDRQFAACMNLLGLPELVEDPRFRDNSSRVEHRDSLIARMSQAFRRQASEYWLARLKAAGVPAAPVRNLAEVFSDPYIAEAGILRTVLHKHAGEVPTVANPVRFSRSTRGVDRASPVLGEHTEEVLRHDLGYSADKIAALRAAGAI